MVGGCVRGAGGVVTCEAADEEDSLGRGEGRGMGEMWDRRGRGAERRDEWER